VAIDLSVTPPPRKSAPRVTASNPVQKSVAIPQQSQQDIRAENVYGIFQLGAFALVMTGQFADAGAIDIHAPAIANELSAVAEQNDTIGKGLDILGKIGPWAGLITVTMPLVLQLLVNHKRIPPEKVGATGVMSPEALESQVKTKLMRQQAEMAKEQLKAQAEFDAVVAEMNSVPRETVRA
jgi:hypothetical protein